MRLLRPGFIVSAYALLQQNLNPTREDVRAWFKKNHNYCRCTGYKQIVDAVMAAAKVMRGEATMEDIQFHGEGKRYYNSSSRARARWQRSAAPRTTARMSA